MTKTMEERIMAAADNFAIAALEDLARNSESSRLERVGCRAALAALVAEACAPEPGRVCRWEYRRRRGNWGRGCGGDESVCPPRVFCPDCGGRIEVVADGQEVE